MHDWLSSSFDKLTVKIIMFDGFIKLAKKKNLTVVFIKKFANEEI